MKKRTVGITFTFNHDTSELYYDTGEYKTRYLSDTIGDFNGFNKVKVSVKGIQNLVDFVHRQITPMGAEYNFITNGALVRCLAKDIQEEYIVKKVIRDEEGSLHDDSSIAIVDNSRELTVYPKELQKLDNGDKKIAITKYH